VTPARGCTTHALLNTPGITWWKGRPRPPLLPNRRYGVSCYKDTNVSRHERVSVSGSSKSSVETHLCCMYHSELRTPSLSTPSLAILDPSFVVVGRIAVQLVPSRQKYTRESQSQRARARVTGTACPGLRCSTDHTISLPKHRHHQPFLRRKL